MSVQKTIDRWLPYALVVIAVVGLAVGGGLALAGSPAVAGVSWTVATLPVLGTLLVQIVLSLRRGDVGLDVVAALSMSAALAFNEALAGNVVALMYSGGRLLETFAQGRARREMTALLGRVARTAMRYNLSGLEEVPINDIAPGDRILIREGEVLPVDGHVASPFALLDLSALTGESAPQRVAQGDEALSGATSAGEAFELIATRRAAESTYAGIVRLVEAAQQSKAPMVRIADRYAMGFLALTLAIAGLAWMISQDPIRVLAVLVVATPCPLILAVPVAIISGMSRVARNGVLVKSGAVLEAMSTIRIAIVDKTGTLTHGRASIADIRTKGAISQDEVLRLAASLDQASSHVLAASLITAAAERGLDLVAPTNIRERPGEGIAGTVDGHRLVIGGIDYVQQAIEGPAAEEMLARIEPEFLAVAVAVDGKMAGVILLQDRIRSDASDMLATLRRAGVRRIVLASGDKADIAQAVGQQIGADLTMGNLTPQQKVSVVKAEAAAGPVMMVGDGVNDAPALAAADVGVAMGARGTAASSEAAGVVVLVDELKPLAAAIVIAVRTRRIAFQSVFVGIGLSIGAMIVAALGYLPPVQGALLQEAIDIAVILNALRALR